MSYEYPNLPVIANPVGIDTVIQQIQTDLKVELSWIDFSFGRAYALGHEIDGQTYTTPKCYDGQGEYVNVLPNDSMKENNRFNSFIRVAGREKVTDYYPHNNGANYERDLDVIFWGNLSNTDPSKDYIFTEELKNQVLKVFQENSAIRSVNEYFDEDPQEIFKGYDLLGTSQRYLMHPYAGFRFNLTVNYSYPC